MRKKTNGTYISRLQVRVIGTCREKYMLVFKFYCLEEEFTIQRCNQVLGFAGLVYPFALKFCLEVIIRANGQRISHCIYSWTYLI